MSPTLKIAARNLVRYRRRTMLTALLIVIGVVAVLTFVGAAGSFKRMMVGLITDSMLGHVQIHRRGYVASIENLPLNLNMGPGMVKRAEELLGSDPHVASYAPRVKFGAMLSNFAETTSIRVNGVDPEREAATTPMLPGRMTERGTGPILNRGEILVPVLLARGLGLKSGDEVVLIATNKEGSVNGKSFRVRSALESVTGPGGRDGYIHIEDAREVLRMSQPEVSEYAVRLTDVEDTERLTAMLAQSMADFKNKQGMPALEVHPWQRLSPFANIANMIDMLTVFVRVLLVAIVLISVMNVMVMAVYERIREIGTMAAIGTRPGSIMSLFVAEGLLMGLFGSAVGIVTSLAVIQAINAAGITFDFGQQKDIPLAAAIAVKDLIAVSAMVTGVAVLASLQPAWKAARMNPITALRHV